LNHTRASAASAARSSTTQRGIASRWA